MSKKMGNYMVVAFSGYYRQKTKTSLTESIPLSLSIIGIIADPEQSTTHSVISEKILHIYSTVDTKDTNGTTDPKLFQNSSV